MPMKIRNSFVSNSSSSNFILIGIHVPKKENAKEIAIKLLQLYNIERNDEDPLYVLGNETHYYYVEDLKLFGYYRAIDEESTDSLEWDTVIEYREELESVLTDSEMPQYNGPVQIFFGTSSDH